MYCISIRILYNCTILAKLRKTDSQMNGWTWHLKGTFHWHVMWVYYTCSGMLCKLSWHQLDDKSDHSSFNIFDGTLFTCIAILLPFCKSVNFMRWKTMYVSFFYSRHFSLRFFPLLVISRCCQYWRLQRIKWLGDWWSEKDLEVVWPNQGTIPALKWRDWENNEKLQSG
jgi:hypothetical protein